MKTSELRKWLEDSEWGYVEYELTIVILGLLKMSKKRKGIEFYDTRWNEGIGLELLNKVLEYVNTPISEREDEKLYEFKSTCSYRYDWGEERLDLYLVKECSLYVYRHGKRQYFTQSEIDNFPADIKGAIECGFLKKVEVK